MTKIMERVIEDVQSLSTNEKNNLMKYLIASLDETHDNDSEQQWANLAKQRYEEIETGKVQTVSWDSIKQQVIS
ncbi:addiction module protein [Halarcobacter sp.]|uniref:addiction module protein n=1 Tax=Halarcobacter sp. TaxID=2321133 RepID=UPI002AA746DB|nr:addiction module protein [Halarcobacter sp.]